MTYDTLLTVSPTLARLPRLAVLLGTPVRYVRRWQRYVPPRTGGKQAVLAWGGKASARYAEQYARRWGLPVVRIEDGFVRSVEPGFASPPYGITLDHQGIYYAAAQPSALEAHIAKPLSTTERARADRLLGLFRHYRVSKYNHARSTLPATLAERACARPAESWVLVVDQTRGDASVAQGLATADSFKQALSCALADHPQHHVVIKTHPDVVAGHKTGYLTTALQEYPATTRERITVTGENVHPPVLLQRVSRVYVVTSQLGFEALLWQKPVHTFGWPFYAGWGLSTDRAPVTAAGRAVQARRQQLLATYGERARPNAASLAYAALVRYSRYYHPETQLPCSVEALMGWLHQQRHARERFPVTLQTGRVPRWKRQAMRRFLAGSQLQSQPGAQPAAVNCPPFVVWGALAAREARQVLRLEDGFIRSVGLGADLTQPLSWVVDDLGMYYDASRPSRLEHILQTATFTETELARAKSLREQLLTHHITKYNTGSGDWQPAAAQSSQPPAARRPVILVPGQVESDASIVLGSPHVRHNLQLLEQVRVVQPDAYVVYKPHPDVQAGLRLPGRGEHQAHTLADEVVTDVDMAVLLTQVDAVHTLTSLTGFEALLRGVPVTCYGQPFYAGWGLTTDIYPPGRRHRQRQLDELVAGTLIRYPRYVSRVSGHFTTPEQAVAEMIAWRKAQPTGWRARLARLRRRGRRTLQWVKRF